MRKTSILAVLAIVALIAMPIGCAAVYGPAAPGQSSDQKIVEDLQKSIIVIHENLYVPAMTLAGSRLNAGGVTPAKEARIQKISEQYQKAKTDADTIIKAWGTVRPAAEDRVALAAKIAEMAKAITDINSAP